VEHRVVDKLSSAQLHERLETCRMRWRSVGTSTAPADRPEAERAIASMYRALGFEPPRIVWCGSPFSQGLIRAVVRTLQSE
jgi:hypothetical protein